MKTLTADVSGRVQGVGFRSFVEQAAARLGLDARAENIDDGTVHVVASGDEHQLMRLVDLLKHGNRYSSVERVDYTIVEHRHAWKGADMDIREHFKDQAHYIDGVLDDCLAPLKESVLYAAMSYSLLSPASACAQPFALLSMSHARATESGSSLSWQPSRWSMPIRSFRMICQ